MIYDIIAAIVLFIITITLVMVGPIKENAAAGVIAPAAIDKTISSMGTQGILRTDFTAGKNPKKLKVAFADTKQERVFSKKTGKIKSDKIRSV